MILPGDIYRLCNQVQQPDHIKTRLQNDWIFNLSKKDINTIAAAKATLTNRGIKK